MDAVSMLFGCCFDTFGKAGSKVTDPKAGLPAEALA
jgi:hypothetical protein